ncbi:hypothetical protein F5883DRAFT_660198 [Diaporthe sp. PMI_573]|nr:hypothetical protein F5883DRAFT_660198 [Diaporthaceae sp. PMI_573]
MADVAPISPEGDGFFISDLEITQALKVRRPIPRLHTEKATSIRFSVKHNECCASVRIDITPFRLEGTANYGFRPFCHVTSCQPTFRDGQLYDQIQKIYDAIVPVQWTFDASCTNIAREQPNAICCQHNTSFNSNSTRRAITQDVRSKKPQFSALPRKRSHNDTSTVSSDVISSELPSPLGTTERDSKRRNPQERKSCKEMVDRFVYRIVKGQDRLKKKKSIATELSGIQAILSRYEEADTRQVLNDLSKEFHKESLAKGTKSDSWDCWYFEGCMDFVNHGKGKVGQSTNAAKAICIINSIVNQLLDTEGAVATALFGVLAEVKARLTEISRESVAIREEFVDRAAQALRGKLQIPPPSYEIPNTPVWVALVKSRSGGESAYNFQDACRDLAFPNLAVLDLKPQWTGSSGREQLLMKVDFALVDACWIKAHQTHPARQAHPAQQTQGPDSGTSQPGTNSPEDPATFDSAGSILGAVAWEADWPSFDINGTANMDGIDFGSANAFGLGSLDGIIGE